LQIKRVKSYFLTNQLCVESTGGTFVWRSGQDGGQPSPLLAAGGGGGASYAGGPDDTLHVVFLQFWLHDFNPIPVITVLLRL
jgi:hypothetical protein